MIISFRCVWEILMNIENQDSTNTSGWQYLVSMHLLEHMCKRRPLQKKLYTNYRQHKGTMEWCMMNILLRGRKQNYWIREKTNVTSIINRQLHRTGGRYVLNSGYTRTTPPKKRSVFLMTTANQFCSTALKCLGIK